MLNLSCLVLPALLGAISPSAIHADSTDTVQARRLPIVGQAAPQIAVNSWLNDSLGGGPRTTFGDGHVYVLDFTASWCGPCRMAYPALALLKSKYAARGVRIVYATRLFGYYGGTRNLTPAAELDSLKQYIAEHHITSSMLVATKSELLKYYAGPNLDFPRVIVIDGAGKVQFFNEGWSPAIPQELDAKLDELTSASAPSTAHKGS